MADRRLFLAGLAVLRRAARWCTTAGRRASPASYLHYNYSVNNTLSQISM